mmetsp:Transcript_57211/g.131325  ORF Transcript_57211/g.131325 Transcript_57211/m.131325 type:complete len:124 (-) Transcript_57211:606-977(-)
MMVAEIAAGPSPTPLLNAPDGVTAVKPESTEARADLRLPLAINEGGCSQAAALPAPPSMAASELRAVVWLAASPSLADSVAFSLALPVWLLAVLEPQLQLGLTLRADTLGRFPLCAVEVLVVS